MVEKFSKFTIVRWGEISKLAEIASKTSNVVDEEMKNRSAAISQNEFEIMISEY